MSKKLFSDDSLERLYYVLEYVRTTYIGEGEHQTLSLGYHDSQNQDTILEVFNAMPRYGRQYKVKYSKTTPKQPLVKYFTFYKYTSLLDEDVLEIKLNSDTFRIKNIKSKHN